MSAPASGGLRVTLIRHGAAEDDAPSDDERALTRDGRTAVRRVGRTLARRKVRFDAIVASPLVRAVQTAEIIAGAVGFRGAVVIHRGLRPMAAATRIRSLLARCGGRRVALVAHEPILSAVLADLVGASRMPALAKAEVVRVRMPAGATGPGQARWRIAPDTGKLHRERTR